MNELVPSDGRKTPSTDADPEVALEALRTQLDELNTVLKRLYALLIPRIFIGPVPAIIVALGTLLSWACGVAALSLSSDGEIVDNMIGGIWVSLGGLVLSMILLSLVRRISAHRFAQVDREFTDLAVMIDMVILDIRRVANEQCEVQEDSVRQRRDREIREARDSFAPKIEQVTPRRDRRHEKLDGNYNELLEKIDSRHVEKTAEEQEHDRTEHARLKQDDDDRRTEIEQEWEHETRAAREQRDRILEGLAVEWNRHVTDFTTSVRDINADLESSRCEPWAEPSWMNWTPSNPFNGFISYGRFQMDTATLTEELPSSERFPWPMDQVVELPAMLDLPRAGSLYIEFAEQGRDEAVQALQNTMLRLLMSLPPGKVRFTVIDPVGLGQNFRRLHAPCRS